MKLIDDLDKALEDRAEALNVKDTYAYNGHPGHKFFFEYELKTLIII